MRLLLFVLVVSSASCSLLFAPPDPSCRVRDLGEFAGARYELFGCSEGAEPTHAEASEACQELGGTLVNMETQDEQDFLLRAIESNDYWLGLRFDIGTGFSWDQSQAPVEFFCGEAGCSSTLPTLPQSTCFVVDPSTGGQWILRDCDDPEDYVCEIEV